jgi:hypothetical protein
MAGENGELRVVLAMRDGNARVGGCGDRGTDAGNNLKAQPRRRERARLLPRRVQRRTDRRPSERTTTFPARVFSTKERIDFLLLERVLPGLLARVNDLPIGPRPLRISVLQR